jgi:hypothetical protein
MDLRLCTGGSLFASEDSDVARAARINVVTEILSVFPSSRIARHCCPILMLSFLFVGTSERTLNGLIPCTCFRFPRDNLGYTINLIILGISPPEGAYILLFLFFNRKDIS